MRSIAAAGLGGALLATATLLARTGLAQTRPVVAYEVEGDAIPLSLTGRAGDARRGEAIALDQARGNCAICHEIPPAAKVHGNVGPSLKGVANRWSEGQLRLRVVDASRINPQTVMPPYHRIDGLTRVAKAYRDKPVLGAEEIEDLVAFLLTLKD
jgi:sulfur-oxidizing protein SoxX